MIITLFVNVVLVICFLFIVRAYAARVSVAVPKTAEPARRYHHRLTKAEMKKIRGDFDWVGGVIADHHFAHGTRTQMATVTTGGCMVLVPGARNTYGRGVYVTDVGPYAMEYATEYVTGYETATIVIIVDGKSAKDEYGRPMFTDRTGISNYYRTNGCGIMLRVVGRQTIKVPRENWPHAKTLLVYAVPVRLLTPEEGDKLSEKIRDGEPTVAPARKIPERHEEEMPPRRWWTRPLGLCLAAYFLHTWKKANDYKSGWLGLFLAGKTVRRRLGFGDVIKAPQALVEEAMQNLLVNDWLPADGKGPRRQIRPHFEKSQLFWMVGTMTLRKNKDGSWFGRDRYDFHKQEGQGVVAQASGVLVWSYSTLTEAQDKKLRLALRFLNIPSSLYRERNGRLEISNNFWNWLGGEPFQTEVRYDGPFHRIAP